MVGTLFGFDSRRLHLTNPARELAFWHFLGVGARAAPVLLHDGEGAFRAGRRTDSATRAADGNPKTAVPRMEHTRAPARVVPAVVDDDRPHTSLGVPFVRVAHVPPPPFRTDGRSTATS